MSKPTRPPQLWRNPVHWLAFGFGAGTLPGAPGTYGTLVAIPIFLLLADWPLWFYITATALCFLVGIWLCDRAANDLGVDDHPGIVWDEIVGYLISMTAVPAHWVWIVAGFVLFRLFDIWKPWPIRQLERRVHGGLGIMLDDALAGLFVVVILQAAVRLPILAG